MLYSQALRESLIERALADSSAAARSAKLESASSLAGMGEQAALAILQFKPAADPQAQAVLTRRQREAAAFRDDWRLYAPRVGRDFYPAVGKPDDHLTILDTARPVHLRLVVLEKAEPLGLPADKRPMISGNEMLALAGAMIDSYQGCVADARNQLRAKLASWVELQRDSPQRNQRIRDHFVAECRGQHQQLAAMAAARARAEAELVQAQGRLQFAQAARSSSPANPSAAPGAVMLNGLSCQ